MDEGGTRSGVVGTDLDDFRGCCSCFGIAAGFCFGVGFGFGDLGVLGEEALATGVAAGVTTPVTGVDAGGEDADGVPA